MSKKYVSMRGEVVDLDRFHANLNSMKKQLETGTTDKTDPTIKRENYVNSRRRRASSKRISEMLANEQAVRQKLADQKSAKEDDAQAEPAVVEQEIFMPTRVDDEFDTDGFAPAEEKEVTALVAPKVEKSQTVTKTRVIKK
jgi:hypothetical protein